MANEKNDKAAQNNPPAPAAPAAPSLNLGDLSAVLGKVVFSHPSGANKPLTYTDGRVQHNKADVQIELGSTGIFLPGRVVAIVTPNAKQADVQFKWITTGTAFRKSIMTAVDAEAAARMEAYRATVVQKFAVWYAANRPTKNAPIKTVASGMIVDLADLGIE